MSIGRNFCKALNILCAVAVVWISFAHRPVVASTTELSIDLSAYVLPDGSLPVICYGGEGDGKTTSSHGCEYCRLADTITLPIPTQLFVRVANAVRNIPDICEETTLSKSIRLVGAPQTGPPSFSI